MTQSEAASGHAGAHRLMNLPMLLLDVSIRSEAELAFLRALSAAAPDTLATVPAGDQPTLGHIRDGLHWKFENLDRASRGAERLSKKTTFERFQRRLFNDYSTVSQAPPDGEVEVFSAPGESRECVEIARRVLAFARDGISFDRIAVLLRSPEEYRAHLQEAFTRARIPAHFVRGAVRPDPAGRAFFSLLKCAAEGLSARRFAEYLSLHDLAVLNKGEIFSLACVKLEPIRVTPQSAENEAAMKATATEATERSIPAEDALRLVIDTTPTLIHTARPDGYIDYFNKGWLEFFGKALEDVRGWRWTDVVHPEDVAGIVRKWQDALETGEPFEWETRVQRADGEYRLMLYRKLPLRDETGAIVKWFGSSRDIQDEKAAQEQMR